jgi:hypothetical protein
MKTLTQTEPTRLSQAKHCLIQALAVLSPAGVPVPGARDITAARLWCAMAALHIGRIMETLPEAQEAFDRQIQKLIQE